VGTDRRDTHESPRVALGVDGCRAGWLAVRLVEAAGGRLTLDYALHARFAPILEQHPDAAAIAVDMPIGLYESGRARMRPCDRIARQRLGKRACCVFIPPTRAMLCAESYMPLRALGLSVQAYHLIPRIRELDALLTPDLQARVWESHPELSFRAMTGAPIASPKRTEAGQAVRMDALRRALGESGDALASLLTAFQQAVAPTHAGIDDLLDACALAWSALRHTRGESELCLGDPAHDARGLQMAIRY
jgi:predicted RNase H-like nuclease